MNPFASLQNDTVYIEKNAGERTGPYKTGIHSKNGFSATIFDASLDVEEGWKLVRKLPNGKEEQFTILETNYSAGLHGIPEHWNLKLQKDTSIKSTPNAQQAMTINISNSQGIQIGDHNIQHIAGSLIGLIEKIDSANCSPEEKEAAKGILRKLMSNPIVAAILSGAASGIIGLLG